MALSTNRSGFSLVEVLISSIVLVIVSSGIMMGIISALKAQNSASDHYRSTCIARNRIQHARTTAFSSYSLLSESNNIIDQNGDLTQVGDFRRSTIITNVASNSVQMTVQVWYQVTPNKFCDQPVQITTMITDSM